MPINDIANLFGVSDDRIWSVVHYYVPKAVESTDWSVLTTIDIDETSRKKGHNYITTVTDFDSFKEELEKVV